MIRKNILCVLLAAACLLSGCARQQSRVEYIGAAKAKELALTASGLSASEVEFTAADLSERSGQDYYRIEFTAQNQDYSYDIDALTGVVIDAKTPDGSSKDSTDLKGAASTNTQTGQEAADGTDAKAVADGADTGSAADGNTDGVMITDQEAKARALAHAGLSDDEVTFAKSSLDFENGKKIYEVEFYTDDHKEYDYEIDASTGEIVSYDYDAESVIPPDSESGSMISEQKAKELALAQVPGASESDIWEFETDRDDGRMQYEGKIIFGGMEYEFEIDAYSGAFRSWEAEPLGD